ncbi:hypothetical protein Cfor_03628 [Coptotermes formosanus]|uniref:Dynein heavy chain tail domain-containing protein n=1 Tax=Coptotermes formosanus TaxID=36987 RepID=A0A6L2P8D3_COPFO|nr:hypothetical protein Cfor_03628 [Coptotermes formosanus]
MSGGSIPERDPRLVYLGRYVQKTLKLKPEKWNRLLSIEEHRTTIMDFLNKPEPMVLIILQNNAAQLLAASSFPVSLKSKAVYFIKRQQGPVPKEEISQHIILGDMAMKPIEQLAALVDEVFVPLLSNPTNQKKWPPVIAQDLQKHVHSLKSTVYQVKGQVSGQTVLPMPVGVERVHEAERKLIESGGEVVDLYLKSAIEGVVIKWATQINDVLIQESSQAFDGGQNPTPNAEVDFWNSRLCNLEYIYEQLRDERVRKMAIILEKTDSAYYPCFRTQFQNVVAALAEAKDIVLYLKPLLRHFAALEEIDFSEITPCLRPLMHVVCLVWANSRYYCNSAKIIVLLRQICNLLIKQAKRFLDPASIFQSDVDEARQRVQESIETLRLFRKIFDDCRDNLPSYFKDGEPVHWTFHPKIVFERFQSFLKRLETIKCFFDTILEFMKLEKVEIGGLKGRLLSSRVVAVFAEFSEHLTMFGSKTYDAMDPEDPAFELDYADFHRKIRDLDRRLASILCQAFDDCCNLESVFKAQYEDRMANLAKHGWMPVDKNMPPVAGALRWAYQLRQRVAIPVRSFKTLQHPIVNSPEASVVLAKYDHLMDLLKTFEHKMFASWAASVPEQCERNLKLSLLTRKATNNELALNFHPELGAILREVHYLSLMEHEDIPEAAVRMYERSETFRKYTSNLDQTIQWYNKVLRQSRPVEFALVEEHMQEIDALIEQGQTNLNWNSTELWDYIERLHRLVHFLEARVQQTQDNLEQIRNIMSMWSKVALFERSDGKKDTLLSIEDQSEHVQRRYREISTAATEIHSLVKQNLKLFGMEQAADSSHWLDYVGYVDNIVCESLLKTVGCRYVMFTSSFICR